MASRFQSSSPCGSGLVIRSWWEVCLQWTTEDVSPPVGWLLIGHKPLYGSVLIFQGLSLLQVLGHFSREEPSVEFTHLPGTSSPAFDDVGSSRFKDNTLTFKSTLVESYLLRLQSEKCGDRSGLDLWLESREPFYQLSLSSLRLRFSSSPETVQVPWLQGRSWRFPVVYEASESVAGYVCLVL